MGMGTLERLIEVARAASPLPAHEEVARHIVRAILIELREPSEAVTDEARLGGPVVLVERDVGRPWARCLSSAEIRQMTAAMIDAILVGKA